MTDREYSVEVYGESRNEVNGPWGGKAYTLRGARVAARRIVTERNGMVFVDIVTIADGALIERIVA